jgi:hypothetical protein
MIGTVISKNGKEIRFTQEKDGFVITAFMTSEKERIIKKGVLWKK